MSTLVAKTIKPTSGDTVTFSDCNVSVGGTLTYDDVTNVDSVGLITARSGIEVSGIVTAPTYYGSGANLSGVESGVVNFVASGTISNGKTVIIKDDGTVGIVTQTTSSTPSGGTPVIYESAAIDYTTASYDSTNGKVVISYADAGNGNYGTAIVGTVSGTSISFGSPVVFQSSNTSYRSSAYDPDEGKVVIIWKDESNNTASAIVGTVSGTSISFGSAAQWESNSVYYPACTYDTTNNKIVIAYTDSDGNNYGKCIVGTVSGTSISFGSAVAFNSSTNNHSSLAFDSTNGKVVIAFADGGNSNYGTAVVGTVSGTSISYGSEVVFESAATQSTSTTFDSTNGKVVITYRDGGNSNYGTAVVGTVSGTSISFGSPVVFESAYINYNTGSYDSTNGKVVVTYADAGNSYYGTAVVGTVSGTSISFTTPVVFESGDSAWQSTAYDSTNGKVVISYKDGDNSSYGTAVVFGVTSQTTNLTTENYIGIAGETISNAATGKVNVVGGVNSGQSGLTTAKTYYVQGNGTLATTAGSPSVVAGTSISSTKIKVR